MESDKVMMYLGIIFFITYLNKIISKKLNIPEVIGYVFMGILLGISILKVFNLEVIETFSSLSTIALGVISFEIGIELKLSTLKKVGKAIIFIVFFEVFGAFLLVTLGIKFISGLDLYAALLLGAVAASTAPAAAVAVIKQFKAKGLLSSSILAVVGIDDAVALVIYVFAASFAKSLIIGSDMNYLILLGKAAGSISFAVGVGAAFSFIYLFLLKKVKSNDIVKILLFAGIFLLLGISEYFGISELLAIMTFGAIVTNVSPVLTKKSQTSVEPFSGILIAILFLMGGAHLDINSIAKVGMIGLVYFLTRTAGKILGGNLGGMLGNAPGPIKKYIGYALLPQVGVALALALSIEKDFTKPIFGEKGIYISALVMNVLLFTTILTEIIGPIFTKYILVKAGEIIITKKE